MRGLIDFPVDLRVRRMYAFFWLEVFLSEVLYEGKSKVVYSGPDIESCVIRYKDTLTALNGEKKIDIEGKGRLNAAISCHIFNYLAEHGVKTHFLKKLDETSVLVRKAEIIMVELIVRNVAAGGFSKKYGVPEGMELKNTVVEFSLKSDSLGDPMINASQITALGIASKQEIDEMIHQSLKINDLMTALLIKANIRLIDFKLEFGRQYSTQYGNEIILCDEITPDCCRLWDAVTNNKMDKDRFRRDMGGVLDGYHDVLERLTKE